MNGTKNLGRLPGLKFMRTLWAPFQFTATKPGKTPLGLEEALGDFGSPPQNSMRSQRNSDGPWIVKVPKREKAEVLAAFAAHKDEVTAGYVAAARCG